MNDRSLDQRECPRTPVSSRGQRNGQSAPRRPGGRTHFRVRTDKVGSCGKVTLRHDSRMFHIAIGRRWKGTPIRLYVADLHIRIVTFDGELLRQLTLETTRTEQPSGLPR